MASKFYECTPPAKEKSYKNYFFKKPTLLDVSNSNSAITMFYSKAKGKNVAIIPFDVKNMKKFVFYNDETGKLWYNCEGLQELKEGEEDGFKSSKGYKKFLKSANGLFKSFTPLLFSIYGYYNDTEIKSVDMFINDNYVDVPIFENIMEKFDFNFFKSESISEFDISKIENRFNIFIKTVPELSTRLASVK